MGRVRHEHRVSPGQRDVARKHGTLGASLFLRGLNQDQLPVANDLLYPVVPVQLCPALLFRPPPADAAPRAPAAAAPVSRLFLVLVDCVDRQFISRLLGVDVVVAVVAVVIQFVGLGLLAGKFAVASNDRLPVGDGDLEVVRVYFREAQKPVLLVPVVDKGRLQ